ncbi:glycosyltransferase [Geodermatophilus obscurus]|uniref:Glycosyl transferase family 2 n=1 Tax=Geodermatophilus obscurus (strain ATCC 25078 / DSM 43160 / JCM 3152 / CCUG 61914 / KCC A-0152 / KCTC 9177 / NBRC 13315 / NRRL B-3577 / G-20) TaxID=526225 RepID=D2S590_GEOOG|nr:glycosyltransferase [Geodermatophilus obscurus]ADB73201.1 glycosyl transferase family 2 [Geodermatophilus obscurus DSM 43160]
MQERTLQRISVVIANHNYGRYVGQAIDSALTLDWDDVEVIVVDDGSTDDSREVIARYEDRITILYQDNATQRVARNRGYELSTGDVVIHLDSDDVLFPSVGRELARVWHEGISKVQFQMLRIDEHGRSLGSVFPRYSRESTPQEIRAWADSTTAYPTPPGSGNAYSRAFLDRIFPLDDSCGPATDSACLAVAPFLGDVVTVAKPLVGYRVHGSNTSDLLADPEKFPRAVERARQRYEYANRVRGDMADGRALRRSRPLLELRIASYRLCPDDRPLAGESFRRLLWDTLRSPAHPGPESIPKRVQVLVWSLLTLLAPDGTARRLVRVRFRRDRRPLRLAAGGR